MRDPINKYFQLGVIQWMIHPEPQYQLVDSVRQLACDDFFEAIEIAPIANAETGAQKRERAFCDTSRRTKAFNNKRPNGFVYRKRSTGLLFCASRYC